jgi:hypothetical protein
VFARDDDAAAVHSMVRSTVRILHCSDASRRTTGPNQKCEKFWTLSLTIGALIGLGVKARMLFYMGVSDMDGYYAWGQRALELGLSKSYEGAYFPLQYQIFELCAWMVQWLNVPFFTIFKGVRFRFVLSPDSSPETARLKSALRLVVLATPLVFVGFFAGICRLPIHVLRLTLRLVAPERVG